MTTPESCTTHSRRRRHYSVDLFGVEWGPGRRGTTLCHENAADQDGVDDWETKWPRNPLTVIADLPECKHCARRLPS
jgi:hypothetical protein